MKVKKETIFLAIIIIGLSIYLFTRQKDRALYELPQLAEVAEKQINKIEIEQGQQSISLVKKDEKWFIQPQDYPAAGSRVNDMTETLAGLTLTALVSESQDYQRYELSEEQKIAVKAYSGDKLVRELDIGKAAPSFRHTFVKLSGDPRVYHARDNFKSRFDVGVDELRDKQVMAFAVADIGQIKLAGKDGELVLNKVKAPLEDNQGNQDQKDGSETQSAVKAEMVWQSQDGRKVDEAKLDRMLSTLSALNCESYLDERTKEDFSDPLYSIEVSGGQTHTLKIFPKTNADDEAYPAVSSQNDYPFTLPGWRTDSLMPAFEELVIEETDTAGEENQE